MDDTTYVRMTVVALHDTYYHLGRATIGVREAMSAAREEADYSKEAELCDILNHTLLALSNLPAKIDNLPF